MSKSDFWEIDPAVSLRWPVGTVLDEASFHGKPGFTGGKEEGVAALAQRGAVLAELQERLYANGRAGNHQAVLLVLQGMDTAGKGGIVKHVVGNVDPQGVHSAAFKAPTRQELQQHFLQRIERQVPAAGQLGVFDRSHYEDVLVARVKQLAPPAEIETRYADIQNFEQELTHRGVTVVKACLMVTPEEQRNRLADRLERPEKHWKYDPSDIDDRLRWPEYKQAYQIMLDRTSTDYAPWYVIPADRKWYARAAITELLIDAFEALALDWPKASFNVEAEKRRLATS